MAVSRVTPPRANATPRGGDKGADARNALQQGLQKAGLTRGGKSAAQAGQQLVSQLGARGFGGGAGTVFAQLAQALASLQRAQGLPVTGRLDDATRNALEQMGLLGGLGLGGFSDQFEGGAKKPQEGAKAAATPKSQAAPPSMKDQALALLSRLLAALGLGGKEGGDGVQNRAEGEGAQTAHALAAAIGQAAEHADLSQLRRDGFGDKDPNGKGAARGDDEGAGKAKKKGDKAGRVGDGDEDEGANARGEDEGGAAEDGDEDGSEEHAHNAPSGDDDGADERRGHASTGDDDDEAGHYRVPTLGAQVTDALASITRAESTTRATTYTLDVTLRRPGVYGPGQKAEELLHLVVQDADAFDEVWDRALASLRALLVRLEPDARPPDRDQLAAALRRARYREPTPPVDDDPAA